MARRPSSVRLCINFCTNRFLQANGRIATKLYKLYTLPKSVQVNFSWGRNDVRTVIEHEYQSFVFTKFCTSPRQISGHAPELRVIGIVDVPLLPVSCTSGI